jgi:hypothetical protein
MVIKGALQAEKRTRQLKTTPWSPRFAHAVNKKSFWKIALSLKCNCKRPNDEFLIWTDNLGITNFKAMDIQTVKKQFRAAQKELQIVEQEAETLREQHLRSMLTEAELNGDETTIQKRLRILLRAQERKTHFQRLKYILKPTAAGGLSYILVPKDFKAEEFPYNSSEVEEWESIHEPDKLKSLLKLRNIHHFGQADGTPFTVPPLDKLDWTTSSMEAEQLLSGTIASVNLHLRQPIYNENLALIAARISLPEIDTYITLEQMSKGFKKWRETTSTSPSGFHLGPPNCILQCLQQQIGRNTTNDTSSTKQHHQHTTNPKGFLPKVLAYGRKRNARKVTRKPISTQTACD